MPTQVDQVSACGSVVGICCLLLQGYYIKFKRCKLQTEVRDVLNRVSTSPLKNTANSIISSASDPQSVNRKYGATDHAAEATRASESVLGI